MTMIYIFLGEFDKKKTQHPSEIDIFTKEHHRVDSSEHSDVNLPSFDVTVTIPEELSKEDEDGDGDGDGDDDRKGKN